MQDDRLARQLGFILELDKLKGVLRRTLTGQDRRENSAEHSWHLAMMAILLHEYANERVDLMRVVQIALVHDIVEIDAGDTFAYDQAGEETKGERERLAAERIFNLLPPDQASCVRALWDEYEFRETPEARFAYAVDRLAPILLNVAGKGRMWQEHGIDARRVLARNEPIRDGSEPLWQYVQDLVAMAVEKKYLKE